MSNNNKYPLTQEQIDQINKLTNNGTQNYHEAYEYIHEQIKGLPDSVVSDDTKYWFEQATEINRNDPDSASNHYIREVTETGLALDGITDVDLQGTSDKIGEAVITDIRKGGSIPPLSDMVSKDINTALVGGSQSIGGWGGSFYYWDEPLTQYGITQKIGEWILEDPAEYEKFMISNSKAIVSTLDHELSQDICDIELREIIEGIGADLPASIKADIATRVIQGMTTGEYIGSPDSINGFEYRNGQWQKPFGSGQYSEEYTTASPEEAARLNEMRSVRQGYQENQEAEAGQGSGATVDSPESEAGLVSDPDAPINQLGSGPGGSAGINPTWGGNDLNNDGIVSDAELLNLQRSAIESGLRGVNDLYNAIDGGDWLGVVDSGLDVAMAIDRYLDTGTDALGGGSEGFISEDMEQSNPLFVSWNAPRNEAGKRTLSRRATRSLCFSAKTGAAELTRTSLKQSSRLSVLSCDARRL